MQAVRESGMWSRCGFNWGVWIVPAYVPDGPRKQEVSAHHYFATRIKADLEG